MRSCARVPNGSTGNQMIKVCDALMGSGKTEAAITYINEHPDKKFIYITPYLSEAERIKDGCPGANFVEPSNKIPDTNFRKVDHTALLIKEGRNIASTHAAFKNYTSDMLEDISSKDYTLIIDESLDVLNELKFCKTDVDLLEKAGCVKKNRYVYYLDDSCVPYPGGVFDSFIKTVRTKDVLWTEGENQTLYCWLIPTDLFTAFNNVIIMTYLFEGQELSCYLQINNASYEKIGVRRDDDGTYRFGDYQEYIPDYVKTLPDKIHILDRPKLNRVGDGRYALSMTWYKSEPEELRQLKNNVLNLFMHIWKDEASPKERMWGTFKDGEAVIKGRGYSKGYLVFNARAMNNFRNRTHLAYLSNVFVNASHRILFSQRGAVLDEDLYALSAMLQWIWRSAIRDGKDIYLYIPSKRMRTLLVDWIDVVSKGGDAGCVSATNVSTGESSVLRKTPVMTAGITNL